MGIAGIVALCVCFSVGYYSFSPGADSFVLLDDVALSQVGGLSTPKISIKGC